MKKIISLILVTAIFMTYVPVGFVQAEESKNLKDDPIYIMNTEATEIEDVNISEELGVDSESVKDLDTENTTNGDIDTFESELKTEEVYLNSTLDFNPETGEMTAVGTLKDEYGNDIKKSYKILVTDYDEENVKATFIDLETGETYNVDTAQLSASVWPLVGVLVGFIAKKGIKAAAKKWGPTVVRAMVRSNDTVAKQVAKSLGYDATNYRSHGAKVFKRGKNGKGPKYITRDQDGHNGGAWKGASTVEKLSKKSTRSGTYDENLKRIGD